MVTTCPNCAAGYNVPDHLVGAAGRWLRCVRCAHEWLAVPPAPMMPVAPAVSEGLASAPSNPPSGRVSAPAMPQASPASVRRGGALVAWMLSLCVLLSLGWGAVHWRGAVMSLWPPSTRAYQIVGLE